MGKITLLIISFLYLESANSQSKDTVLNKPANIVFLLDVSNSMGKDNKMVLLKKSTEELLKLLNKKDRISLISFGNTVDLLYNTSSYVGPDTILKIISKIRSKASATNINGGLIEGYEAALRNYVTYGINHILLITDGEFVLNNYSRQLVKTNASVTLTGVVIGKGPEADKAVGI
jgi:secreted protein with Ig-like and vWFA domain